MTGSEARSQIFAVLRIQWLSLKNSLRRRSDFVGLLFSIVLAVLWYGMWTAGAVGLFAFTAWISPDKLARALPGILFLIVLYWQVSPLLTATMGVSIDMRKMALYPINPRTLFVIECLLRLLTGLEMLLLLAGISLGVAVKTPQAAVAFAPALALFVLFNVLLSAGTRNLIERLLLRRGLRELFFFLLVLASASPQMILWSGAGPRVGQRLYRTFRFLPQSILPSTALSHAYLGALTAADWLVMAVWCVLAGAFGYFQFQRSFRSDGAAAGLPARANDERAPWTERVYTLPSRLLPDPAGALVEKEIRYLVRSARFRFLFLMGCFFGVLAWLPFAMRHGSSGTGGLQHHFLTLLSLYGLLLLGQLTFLNSFGLDRSAARYLFWMPISPSTLLAAKNVVGGLFLTLQVMILALICLLLRVLAGVTQVVEALVVTGIAALYLCSAGNLTSVIFASGLNPERVSRGRRGRGLQGLIVFL